MIIYGAKISKIVGEREIFVSQDGKIFYEVNDLGFSQSVQKFEEAGKPFYKEKSWTYNRGDTISFNKLTYTPAKVPKTIQAVRLPVLRELRYLYKFNDKDWYVAVTVDHYHDFYLNWHVASGPLGRMKLLTGVDVDISNSIIKTHGGTLNVANPTNLTWDANALTKQKAEQYELIEQGSTVILKKK